LQQAAKKKIPKNFRSFHFTSITVSLNKKNAKNRRYVYISSRRGGVAFSQKNDIKKLIMSKIKPKKTQSQVNFTEYSQLCEYVWKVGRMRQLSIVVTSKNMGKG
jgi:hypothetical protein